jgi:chromosome partitioning protein
MIVLIGGEKGGTGKTTLATNLAAMRVREGRDVLLLDTDIQGTANLWSQLRDEQGIVPRVPTVQKFGKGLAHELADLASRYQDIIIDAGGRDSAELRASMLMADIAIVPVQASQFDLWTLDRLDEMVRMAQAYRPSKPLVVKILISRASPNPSVAEARHAAKLVAEFEMFTLAETVIRDRIAFRKAATEGRCVVELFDPKTDKAAFEITKLYQEIFINHSQIAEVL